MIDTLCRKLCISLAAAAALASSAAHAGGIDWYLAGPAFAAGEADAPMVYNRKDASRCVGLWTLHGEAIDTVGTFPPAAHGAFPDELHLQYAINAAEFFGEDGLNDVAFRQAADDAKLQLRRVLAGDKKAFRLYFEALGKCSTRPESVGDEGGDAAGDAIDAPAGE